MDAFESARSALPAWTGFAGLLYWPAAVFAISLFVAWGISFAGLRPLRRAARKKIALHWTERARVSYPVRVALGVGFFIAFLLPLALSHSFASPFARTPGWLTGVAVVLAAWAGFLLGGRGGSRLILGEAMPLREQLQNSAVITFLYLPLLIVFAILASTMPDRMDGRAWVLLALGAAAMALAVWRSGVPNLRLLRLAHPASERLRRIVEQAAERAGKRPAAVWEVDWTAGNAVALVYSNELVFTCGALRLLDDEQLATIAAHEIGHLSEPLRVKAVRTLAAWALLALATAAPVYRTYGWTGLSLLYFGFLAVVVGLRLLARRMEVRADAIGRGQEGEAGVYARALERLYEHNLAPAVVRGRLKVHPSLWDRMIAAGLQPDYPRPAPPSRGRVLGLYLLLLILFAVGHDGPARAAPAPAAAPPRGAEPRPADRPERRSLLPAPPGLSPLGGKPPGGRRGSLGRGGGSGAVVRFYTFRNSRAKNRTAPAYPSIPTRSSVPWRRGRSLASMGTARKR